MAGAIAAMGSITYPAISAFVSAHASPDSQGKKILKHFFAPLLV